MNPINSRQVLSCPAPYGSGGLGRHLTEIVEDMRANGSLVRYFCTSPRAEDLPSGVGQAIIDTGLNWRLRYTPARFNPGRRCFLTVDRFDRKVAAKLTKAGDTFCAFVGAARESFERARKIGFSRLLLVAANSHVDNVQAQHAMAYARNPLEPSWLDDDQRRKTLEEYSLADQILVASRYTEASFLERGIPADKLIRFEFSPHPRFSAAATQRATSQQQHPFKIVYIGSLSVAKGIPVLLDAFRRFDRRDAELTLIGGSASRGMARYLRDAVRSDPRICIKPGDPFPHLMSADVCVHPTWEDGFAYAPMEALAAGVPVIVTDQTGMKDFVRENVNGYIIPAGDVDALLDRLDAIASGALARRTSPSAAPEQAKVSAP